MMKKMMTMMMRLMMRQIWIDVKLIMDVVKAINEKITYFNDYKSFTEICAVNSDP